MAEGVFLCSIRLLTLQYLNSYSLEEVKLKSVTPRIISLSGAGSVQTCLVLGLSFAQINLSIRAFLVLPAIALRHLYFSCPGESSSNIHTCKF